MNSEKKTKEISDGHEKVSAEIGQYLVEMMKRKVKQLKLYDPLKKPLKLFFGKPKKKPQDDIVLRMIRSTMAKEMRFSLLRVGVNAGGLLVGTIETTAKCVAQAIKFFLDQPDLLEKRYFWHGKKISKNLIVWCGRR